jgi:hypothetical protein
LLNKPPTESNLATSLHRVNRGTPVGDQRWIESNSKQLGPDSTRRPRGRPKKENEESGRLMLSSIARFGGCNWLTAFLRLSDNDIRAINGSWNLSASSCWGERQKSIYLSWPKSPDFGRESPSLARSATESFHPPLASKA